MISDKRLVQVSVMLTILSLLLLASMARNRRLSVALAAKPKIEIQLVEKIRTVRIAGPVRIRERIVQIPGEGRMIEREVFRDPVTTETGKEREAHVEQAPVCAEPAAVGHKRWLFGLAARPGAPGGNLFKVDGVRAGINLFDRLDLSGGYRFHGQDRLFVEAGLRF